jgi:small subunit ribosomal protein S5
MAEKKESTGQVAVPQSKEKFIDFVGSVRRVTKVTKGGKRFSFSAFVISGDGQGKVGFALGKSREVSLAIAKATSRARKSMIDLPLRGSTIPYPVTGYHGACKVILRPASKGTGNIAGGSVRAIMSAAGIGDVLTKAFGAANSQNVAKATMNALAQLRSALKLAKMRGTTIEKMVKGV